MSAGQSRKKSSLLVATEQTFREQFAIDVRTRCEVVGIDAAQKTVQLKNHVTGEVTSERYDKLVLSPGAAPIRPPLPGIDLPGIFSVRTVPDARNIRAWLDRDATGSSGMHSYTGMQTVLPAKRAVVVGGGFIGLEMVENLIHRGLEVTLVERLNQVMPPLDPEMARLVERYMVRHGVQLELNDGVAGFEQTADWRVGGPYQFRQAAAGGHRDPGDWRATGDGAGEDGWHRDRPARRHSRRRADAHQRPRHLRRRRCG